MKVTVTDFEGDYKAYGVKVRDGYADRRWHSVNERDPRDIDVLDTEVLFFGTEQIASLYGDVMRDKLLNKSTGRPVVEEVGLKLVTITLSFNELNKMAGQLSAQHGGKRLSDVPADGNDPISQIFKEATEEHGLGFDMQAFYAMTTNQLKSITAAETPSYPKVEDGMSDGCMQEPDDYIGGYSHAGAILKDMHHIAAFHQIDFPAYSAKNKYVICGVFTTSARDLKAKDFPLPDQNRKPEHYVIDEARRALKI